MPLSEAKSLLRRDGHFHIFEHDPETDEEAIERLADSLESFSPIVGLKMVDEAERKRGHRPDSLLLDVTGLAHLFGDENHLACQLLQHCDTLGYLPRIATADTVGVAWAMARYFAGQYFAQHQQPFVLPPGDQEAIKQLPVESLRLEPVTVDTLYQLGVETIGQLQRLPRNDLAMRFGNTIHRRLDQMTGEIEEPVIARRKPAEFISGQLLEHPTHHRETIEVIIARLVAELCEQMRAAQQGALQWTIRLDCQSGSPLEFQVSLFQPTATTGQVMPLVEMQLEQALSPHTKKYRKRVASVATGSVAVRSANERSVAVRSANERSVAVRSANERSVAVRSANERNFAERNATNNATNSTYTTNNDQEPENQFHRYTTIQVNEITVSVTSSVLLAQQQRQLFDQNPRLDRQSLAHLINRLSSRLGPQNVVYPSLQSGAQPEYSFRLRPLVDPRRQRRRRKTKPPQPSHRLARPFRLFHPPLRLKKGVRSLFPNPSGNGKPEKRGIGKEVRNQWREVPEGPFQKKRPAPFSFGAPPALLQIESSRGPRQPQKIIASWGPERIETGWWRGPTVCRDYWRVETETHQQLWIFHDLRNGEWFLHGEF